MYKNRDFSETEEPSSLFDKKITGITYKVAYWAIFITFSITAAGFKAYIDIMNGINDVKHANVIQDLEMKNLKNKQEEIDSRLKIVEQKVNK